MWPIVNIPGGLFQKFEAILLYIEQNEKRNITVKSSIIKLVHGVFYGNKDQKPGRENTENLSSEKKPALMIAR
jgi:hypothetical protein